jgi:hypothetical protein
MSGSPIGWGVGAALAIVGGIASATDHLFGGAAYAVLGVGVLVLGLQLRAKAAPTAFETWQTKPRR